MIYGSQNVLRKTSKAIGIKFENLSNIDNISLIDVFDPGNFEFGKEAENTGKAQVKYIEKAIEDAQNGKIDAIVTLPINKKAASMAGFPFPGHTEFLAEKFGAKHYAMMLASKELKVVLLTTHVALRKVPDLINESSIIEKLKLINDTFKGEKIAVAALNPHAGEGGLFGSEEMQIIEPAVNKAKGIGINVEGPFPSDTVFVRTLKGEFKTVLCMYHDQGLIPIKLLSFGKCANVTLGLPIVRTSVDHGTAYDIAGKGIADPSSFKFAVNYALELLRKKTENKVW